MLFSMTDASNTESNEVQAAHIRLLFNMTVLAVQKSVGNLSEIQRTSYTAYDSRHTVVCLFVQPSRPC